MFSIRDIDNFKFEKNFYFIESEGVLVEVTPRGQVDLLVPSKEFFGGIKDVFISEKLIKDDIDEVLRREEKISDYLSIKEEYIELLERRGLLNYDNDIVEILEPAEFLLRIFSEDEEVDEVEMILSFNFPVLYKFEI